MRICGRASVIGHRVAHEDAVDLLMGTGPVLVIDVDRVSSSDATNGWDAARGSRSTRVSACRVEEFQ
jgi:hypothetical protein